jgi:hypothetical protein
MKIRLAKSQHQRFLDQHRHAKAIPPLILRQLPPEQHLDHRECQEKL